MVRRNLTTTGIPLKITIAVLLKERFQDLLVFDLDNEWLLRRSWNDLLSLQITLVNYRKLGYKSQVTECSGYFTLMHCQGQVHTK